MKKKKEILPPAAERNPQFIEFKNCMHHALTVNALNFGSDMNAVEPSIECTSKFIAREMIRRVRRYKYRENEYCLIMHDLVSKADIFDSKGMHGFGHGWVCRDAAHILRTQY